MSDAFQTHAAFSWSELRSTDIEKAKAFYTDVIGWTTEPMDMGEGGIYTVLKIGDMPVGGMMAMPEAAAGAPSHWMLYVTVDDVDKRLEQATAAGGTITMPPMDVPGVGRMASFTDPTGAEISIITYEQKDC